jgi:hypothetical protein
MKLKLAHFFLAAVLTMPLFSYADLDRISRRELMNGVHEETQKFMQLFTEVDKHCSQSTAKQVAGSIINFINFERLGFAKHETEPISKACRLATKNFKTYLRELFQNNKTLLLKLIESLNNHGEFDQNIACSDLPIKKSRYAFGNTHRVTQMRSGEYLVQVSIDFKATSEVSKSAEIELRKRSTQCVNQAGYMQDHKGQKIRLQIEKPGTAQAKHLFTHEVAIRKGIRSNNKNYDINISCPTILHEVFHLVGLNDEYHEEGYNCRAIGKSIMAQHYHYSPTQYGVVAIPSLLKKPGMPGASPLELVFANHPKEIEFSKVDSIECYDLNSRSYKALNYTAENKLYFKESDGRLTKFATPPFKYATFIPTAEVEAEIQTSRPYMTEFMKLNSNTNWDCRIATDAAGTRIKGSKLITPATYPIRPAHFRKIVYPSCIEKNRRYDTCTREGYLQGQAPGYQCAVHKYKACQNERFLE